uniref:GIY-YIG nuclease family protein n=1 Tax=candidate division CPR3 bacterium TaxID=2268181 RepID=A0A7C4R2N9_UNCC3
MDQWYLYILICKGDKLYTDIAKDVEARFELHKTGKGAKYTRANKPIKIVYTEEFKTRSRALKREAEIKKMNREEKDVLVSIKKINKKSAKRFWE